jgi:trigger factor
MQELRNDIANKLKEAAEKKAENQLRLAAVKKVSENTQVEIPQAMIDNRVNQMINDFAYHLATQGITLEKYLEGTNTKIEDIKAYYEGEARSTVKADLVLEAVAKAEGIKATAEDVEKQIKRMAEQYKQEPEKIREALEKQGQLSGLEFGIMLDKAVDFVVEHAKVEIVPAQTAEAAGAPKESNAGETKATKEKTAK